METSGASSGADGKRQDRGAWRGSGLKGVLFVAVVSVVFGLGVLAYARPGSVPFSVGVALVLVAVGVVLVALVAWLLLRAFVRAQRASGRSQPAAASVREGDAALVVELRATLASVEARLADLERAARSAPAAPSPVVEATVVADPVVALAPPARPSPFGDVGPVIDVEGIGVVYAERLKLAGIVNTRELWEAEPRGLASRIGVPLPLVEGWQQMSELMAVSGIGPQYAELLVRAGVRSIRELAGSDPQDLLGRITATAAGSSRRIQGNRIGLPTVTRWIRAAKEHKIPAGAV